jgi:hypothetical protein
MGEIRKITTIPILGKTGINFFCIAEKIAELYDNMDEFSRQKNIKHLGLVSRVIEGATHSRYEYVMLQAGITDLMDNLHKGSPTASQGSIKIDGKQYNGNAVLKAWFLLSNFGHAVNTIADEKALLLFANKQDGFKSQLLAPIRDEALKEWSKNIIDNFEYTKFHHILAIRKMYKNLPRKVELQNEIATIYKLLLLEEDLITNKVNLAKLAQLKRIFNTIRALSIVTIDGYYSHSPITLDLIPTILSIDSSESAYHGKFLSDSIEPLLNALHESIYLDKDVLTHERFYEIKSLEYLESLEKRNVRYEEALTKSLTEGLFNFTDCPLEHFTRLSITPIMQPKTSFYYEFRNLQTVKRGCRGVEALLDINPLTKIRYADFFIDKNKFEPKELPRFIFNIAQLIRLQINYMIENSSSDFREILNELKSNLVTKGVSSNLIDTTISESKNIINKHTWNVFKSDVFPSFKDLLWSILKFFLNSDYQIDIDSAKKEYDSFGMKIPEGDVGLLDENIIKAIGIEQNDEDRVHELNHLRKAANRKFNGYVFSCLSRITVYNRTKPPSEKIVTDIDSLVIKVSQTEFIIELNETKNYRNSREKKAAKELRKNLAPVINTRGIGYRIVEVKNFGAKLVLKIKNT